MLPEFRRDPGRRTRAARALTVSVAGLLTLSCHTAGPRVPWASPGPAVSFEHADVRTLNDDYRRTDARVLLREVLVPTRAALDYAAYHANFIIADPPPEDAPQAAEGQPIDTKNPFDGVIEENTLSGDVRSTPLSDEERSHPLAFPPLLEYLRSEEVQGAQELEQVGTKVREESWGLPVRPGLASQSIAELFVHAQGAKRELWAKIEFQPWVTGLGALPDQDGDGVPEVYGKVRPDQVNAAIFPVIEEKYRGERLSAEEIRTWANRLAAYWYPSFNTDLLPPGAAWPDAQTEPEIKKQLGDRVYREPTIVLRGKPQGAAVYQLFFVKSGEGAAASGGAPRRAGSVLKLSKTRPTPDPSATLARLQRELTQHDDSFERWTKSAEPAKKLLRARLRGMPPKSKALAGDDGFLFFRNSLEYATSGDLEKQKKGKNPLPVIVEFQKALAARGVDFLFVPVPTKVEVYPERVDPKLSAFAGEVVNPNARKFLLALSKAGVEVVDLLPAFLEARKARASELVFQRQDTHWTDPGLRLAADLISARLKKYPWYKELSRQSRRFTTREVKFQRLGDLHSRLPEGLKARYQPEQLVANQVLDEGGTPYEDDPDSPIVVLGDSFTGVYQLMDAEHAGLSAHIAKDVGYPVDLVMSYGGGPNVRNKLMRRGAAALDAKKVVIWVMTARDLHDFWEDWEPLDAK